MNTAVQTIVSGQILEAKTASFTTDSGEDQTYGKVQLLVPDASGEFKAIFNVKVRTENYGLLPELKALQGKKVTIHCSTSQYKNQAVSYYLEKVA